MITVQIFNGMETELSTNEGAVSENLKIFRHFYYSKMCNLVGMTSVTKEYVNTLVQPDFECISAEVTNGGFIELKFERVEPQQAETPCSSTIYCAPTEDLKRETINNVTEEVVKEATVTEEQPKKKKRGRPPKSAT